MSVIIDFTNIPTKTSDELDEIYTSDTIYDISKIMGDKGVYNIMIQDFIDIMKYGFEFEKIRRRPILVKFKDQKEPIVMQLNHFITNLLFWQSLIDIDRVELLDSKWIFDLTTFNTDTLMKYVNDKLVSIEGIEFKDMNLMVDELYHNLVSLSKAFAPLMGMSISLYDIHQLEQRIPEVSEIMRGDIDESLPTHEIETILANNNNRLIDLLVNDIQMNDFKPFFASKSGLKKDQFREFMVRIGFKADINGNTVPIFINNNFLVHGLDKPSNIYLNAISGRKALMLSKLSMSKPGAFSKKLVYQAAIATLRDDDYICDSIYSVDYDIYNDEILKSLHGRYYYDINGDMYLLNYINDKHLIGKIVRFRSPCTCTSTEGVCRYCYGHLFDINKSLGSAGALAALKISMPIGQMVLSSKHSQTTASNNIEFSEGFDEIFDSSNSVIMLKEESELDAEVFIRLNDVSVEEMDDTEFYSVDTFDIVDANNQVIHHIKEESGARFYLNDIMVSLYKQKLRTRGPDLIPLEDISEEESLFTVEVKNKELTEPLKVFTQILNSKDHMGAYNDISKICQIFGEKLLVMGIKFEFVHAEMIVRTLIRKRSNILEFPDFSVTGTPGDHQILKLNDGQLYHPSALVSLPYGYLRRQLLSTELYEKNAPGPLDALYLPKLSSHI